MARDDLIRYGRKWYGEQFVPALAADLGYAQSSVRRVVTGRTPVSPRMELAMEKRIRQHRFEALARPEVRYE